MLGQAIGRLLRMPPTISLRHISIQRVTVAERLDHLRGLLRRGRFSFDEAVRGEDRMTVAVTVFALLELYKRGEAWWEQDESFGEIAVHAVAAGAVPALESRRRVPEDSRVERAVRAGYRPRGTSDSPLEDRQSAADQEDVLATDVESEQLSDPSQDADPESAPGAGERCRGRYDHKRALTSMGCSSPTRRVVRTVEALLFLAPDPLSPQEIAEAAATEELGVIAALAQLAERYAPGRSGINLRELGGGFTFASDPDSEESARRLFSRPRASVLTPAQAETLAIVAYLQPVSRPEITRIRGVSADSAASTLLERGLVEESGRSQFGAVLYRTTTQFLKLFGLKSIEELPDVAQWDPTPEEQAELRDRLLRAGEARAPHGGTYPEGTGQAGGGPQPELHSSQAARAASCPQAASMSRPRVRRTVAWIPRASSAPLNAAIESRLDPSYESPWG